MKTIPFIFLFLSSAILGLLVALVVYGITTTSAAIAKISGRELLGDSIFTYQYPAMAVCGIIATIVMMWMVRNRKEQQYGRRF